MTDAIIELSADDPDPALGTGPSVSFVSAADRRLHAPDRSLVLSRDGRLRARLSCWWTHTPALESQPLAVIGHYAAEDLDAGVRILEAACRLLQREGHTHVVGPMDGNTWRRYRFIVERGAEPAFALEPDNPDEWPGHWTSAGFEPLTTYLSAVNEDPGGEDSRTDLSVERLRDAGVTIRAYDPQTGDTDLQRIYELSLEAFRDNFLYTPIGRDEFVGQYKAVLPYVQPELVLLAERGAELIGYMFTMPDILRARRGAPMDTAILKTLAVSPDARGAGLGGALLGLAQRRAHQLGYRRVIHALFHEANISGRISGRYARVMRRYALFSRSLTA